MTSQFGDMETSSEFIGVPVSLLSGLVIGPSFMSISLLVLELSRNQKYSCLSSTQYLELGQGLVMDTKFGKNVSNEMLLNAANC